MKCKLYIINCRKIKQQKGEKMISLRVHSLVDVITNSSTVIYTYCDGAVGPAKELINAFLKALDVTDKKADDMFNFGVFLSDYDRYFGFEYDEDTEIPKEIKDSDLSYEDQRKFIEDIISRIMAGDIEKPEWMVEVEYAENYDGYRYSTDIKIEVKDPKYQPVADAIRNLIFSIDSEAEYDS